MSSCKDDFIWDPKIWDCEYNKTCKIDQYLEMRWNIKWNIRMRQYDEILIQLKPHLLIKKKKIIASVTIFCWSLYAYYYLL